MPQHSVDMRTQDMTLAKLPAARAWAVREAVACAVASREFVRMWPTFHEKPCAASGERAPVNCSSLLTEACFIAGSCVEARARGVNHDRCVLALHWSAVTGRLHHPVNASERKCRPQRVSALTTPASVSASASGGAAELTRPFNWSDAALDGFQAPLVHPFGSTLCPPQAVEAVPTSVALPPGTNPSRCSPRAVTASVWLLVGVHSTAGGWKKREALCGKQGRWPASQNLSANWPRLVALSLVWRWWGVLEGELTEASGRLFFT